MWTSLLFVSTANFIIPLIIFLRCLTFRSQYNVDRSTLTAKQRELLKMIHAKSSTIKDYIDSSTYGEDVVSADEGEMHDNINISPPPPHISHPGPPPMGSLPRPPGRSSTLHPNTANIDEFSGLDESDVLGRRQTHSVFRKSTRYLAQEEMAAATDADIDLILQDDVPDPMTEDREFFIRRNTTRISRARSGRGSMTAFMHADSQEEDGEGMEMGDIVRSGMLDVPGAPRFTRTSSSSDGGSARMRSRSPVRFYDQEGGESSPSVRPIPPQRSKPSESSDMGRDDPIDRRMTLPSHPQYIGRTFRSIPRFLSQFISPRAAAIVCLSITGTITILNIILNIAIPPQ
jgi:hypothetical protein